MLRPAPENLLESVENGWLVRLEENLQGSTCPKAVSTLWFRSSWSCLSAPSPLPFVITQPCHSDRGDTACRSCPTRSVADTTPLPCFSPVLTDAVAFHYFPVTYTNTTFNKLSKLQLSNKNRFLCSDC